MSTYDKASLVLIPSGTKTSKIYSQKPINGDGDFSFSRSTSATRVNQSGLIEKETGNLLNYSNDFSESAWVNTDVSVTGGQAGYDGSSDAWLLTKFTGGAFSRNAQGLSTSGVQVFSIYAKANTLTWIRLLGIGSSNNPYAYYDLTNGVLGTKHSSVIDFSIESIGNGWYRCDMVFNEVLSEVRIYPVTGDGDFSTAGSIYIQDAQLEQGLVARDYQETTTSAVYGGITDNVPRIDYTDASCPSLLLEPTRTNLVLSSEYPHNSGIDGIPFARGGANITYNYGISPEGLQNSTLVSGTSGNVGIQVSFSNSDINVDWSYSFYIKGNSGETVHLRYELTPYVLNSQEYITFTGDWQRIEKTISYDGTAHTVKQWYVTFLQQSTATQFEIYGLQAESNAAYPTSYIPTYGTSVTRNSEDNQLLNLQSNNLITSTQGTMVLDAEDDDSTAVQYDIKGTTALEYALRFRFAETYIVVIQRANNVQTNLRTITGLSVGRKKIAYSWSGTNLITSVNGTSYTNTIDASIAAELNRIVRSNLNSTKIKINKMMLFPTQLTEAELNDLTTI
jgi:hypothetical protein